MRAPPRRLRRRRLVDPPRPARGAGAVVVGRPLALQQRLGLAVAVLLAQVAPDRVAAPVHDDRAGAEAEGAVRLLQPPAEVDVVSGDLEALVEAADLVEHVPAEGHVAAGDVLGLAVGDEDVDRAAGRGGDAFGDEAVVLGRDVRPADAGVAVGAQQRRDVVEPVGVGVGVVVEEGDDLAAWPPRSRCCARGRGRGARSRSGMAPWSAAISAAGVAGAVVDDDHLVVGVVQRRPGGPGTRRGSRCAVVGADDDRDRRPGPARRERDRRVGAR